MPRPPQWPEGHIRSGFLSLEITPTTLDLSCACSSHNICFSCFSSINKSNIFPNQTYSPVFCNWKNDTAEKWEIKIGRLQRRFYALAASKRPDDPTQGSSCSRRLKSGFCARTAASPRHQFSALRHGVVTSCHGVLLHCYFV